MPERTLEDLGRELDGFMDRAGLTLPPGRRATVLTAYADFRAQIDLLHGRQDHTGEPAHIYALTPAEAV